MTGVDLKVKYDPRYLVFTDRQGREANQVEIQEPVNKYDIETLKTTAKNLGVAVTDYTTKDELIRMVEAARKSFAERPSRIS